MTSFRTFSTIMDNATASLESNRFVELSSRYPRADRGYLRALLARQLSPADIEEKLALGLYPERECVRTSADGEDRSMQLNRHVLAPLFELLPNIDPLVARNAVDCLRGINMSTSTMQGRPRAATAIASVAARTPSTPTLRYRADSSPTRGDGFMLPASSADSGIHSLLLLHATVDKLLRDMDSVSVGARLGTSAMPSGTAETISPRQSSHTLSYRAERAKRKSSSTISIPSVFYRSRQCG